MTLDNESISAYASAISAICAVLSLGGIFLIWDQLKQARKQSQMNTEQLLLTQKIAQLQFEDGLAKEYRELASRIPTKALLGAGLSPREYEDAFDELFRYIDLSNEQVFLRKSDRIGESTWQNWCSGIQYNLSLPVFRRAWEAIQEKNPRQFAELKELERTNFFVDPASWVKKD